jgi:hypothetical protein
MTTSPPAAVTGVITEVAQADADDLPPRLVDALDLPQRRGAEGGARPAHLYYQARVALDRHEAALAVGMTGRAKVAAGWQPPALRFWRYLQRTFRLS